jgi:hypothetical protein
MLPAFAAAVFGLLAFAPSAKAQSLTGNVGSAGVTAGEHAVEARFGVDDEGAAGARAHYDYAFTGWYQLRLIGAFAKPDDDDWDFSSFTIENWLQWREEADDNSGFNGGVRFAYSIAGDGDPDEAEVRLTLTDKFAQDWEWRANVIGEMEVGDNSADGVFLETRGQLTRGFDFTALGSQDWRFGAEIFSEFGNTTDIPGFDDQAHQIGPVVKTSWENGVYLQSAVRFGVTEGADDSMFKIFVGREF